MKLTKSDSTCVTRRDALALTAGLGLAIATGPDLARAEVCEVMDDPVENSFRYIDGEPIVDEGDANPIATFSATAPWSKNDEGVWCNGSGDPIPGAVYRGIDVSSHQGRIDWDAAKSDGVDFAIIRAAWSIPYTNGKGEYKTGVDDYWERNVSECERLGIPYGVYIYSYATSPTSGRKYADHVLSLLRGHSPSYPVYIDIEDDSTRDGDLNGVAESFCRRIEEAGFRPGVYASLSWFNDYLSSPELNHWSKWVAQYYKKCTYSGPFDMWQASMSAYVDGVGRVDIDFDFSCLASDSDAASSKWSRLYGATKLDTSAEISKTGWDHSDSVVVATLDRFMDALAASSLAGSLDCPILLTAQDSLSSQTANEIKRLGAKHAYVIGGPIAVAESVDDSIRSAGCPDVIRVYGNDYQLTACEIADRVLRGSHGDTLIIATARSFHDALSISPYSFRSKSPIYLCDSANSLSSYVLERIRRSGLKSAIVLGGPLAVDLGVEDQLASVGITTVKRISGDTRFATSALIAQWEIEKGMSTGNLAFATSETFYDALTGGPLCGRRNSALLVVSDDDKSCVTGFGASHKDQVSAGIVLGGPLAVSHACWNSIVRYCS